MPSVVYFSRIITPERLIDLYEKLGVCLPSPVAVKLHSGEEGNQNYLRPEFLRPMIEHVGGTVVECNTAYDGERNTTEKHLRTIKRHGWNEHFAFDLIYIDLFSCDRESDLFPVSEECNINIRSRVVSRRNILLRARKNQQRRQ